MALGNPDDPCDGSRRRKYKINVYDKLHTVNENGDRDVAFWLASQYNEIFETRCKVILVGKLHPYSIEILFEIEEVLKALNSYNKFVYDRGDTCSIMPLVILDSIITSTADSFRF